MSRSPVVHSMKLAPQFFEAALAGEKNNEYRDLSDRDIAVGDTIVLKEWVRSALVPLGRLTGRETPPRLVTHILTHEMFDQVPPGWGIISLADAPQEAPLAELGGSDLPLSNVVQLDPSTTGEIDPRLVLSSALQVVELEQLHGIVLTGWVLDEWSHRQFFYASSVGSEKAVFTLQRGIKEVMDREQMNEDDPR